MSTDIVDFDMDVLPVGYRCADDSLVDGFACFNKRSVLSTLFKQCGSQTFLFQLSDVSDRINQQWLYLLF